jgi:EAL domain-containing protein (putative c-di-GMP-specific phosphodiesterase class I)
MQKEIMNKANLEKCLITGIKNEEFSLVFQPQYSSHNKRLRGIEALIRWDSSELGKVSPMDFIPLAEETGLIVPLGKWILETACRKFVKLQERYNLDAYISVNISTVQIKDSSFAETVKNILNETGLDPSCLELEITESVFIESIDEAAPILIKLKALGIQLALDDFGTGYSSLSYLKLLPIDTLKIDKSFIDDLPEDPNQVCIVEDIISLGHKLGITVVAEGVEYTHQLNYLTKHSCDYIQGYLFSRPLDEQALEKLLAG